MLSVPRLMHSGRAPDIANLRPRDVDLEDIAHSLALTNRFGGHSRSPYSVAAHSMFVADLLQAAPRSTPNLVLAGLLHDAEEAYWGDITTPVKRLLGPDIHAVMGRTRSVVWRALGLRPLSPTQTALVHAADRVAVYMERNALWTERDPIVWTADDKRLIPEWVARHFDLSPWTIYDQLPPLERSAVEDHDWALTKAQFIVRYRMYRQNKEKAA